MSDAIKITATSNITKDNLVLLYDKKPLIPPELESLAKEASQVLKLANAEASAPKTVEFFDNSAGSSRKIYLVPIKSPKAALWELKLGGAIGKKLLADHYKKFTVVIPPVVKDLLSFIEGLLLGSYSFSDYKTEPKSKPVLSQLSLHSADKQLAKTLKLARNLSDSVKITRDVANLAGNDFRPKDFKAKSATLAKEHQLKFTALDEQHFKKQGMNCFYAVAKGSSEPAFLNIIEHKAPKAKETVLIVGKGLTFDSGGYSLKPATSMEEMKFDMCGGAAVLGLMNLVGIYQPEVNIVGMIAASENLINGQACKPGDIVTAYNQKTVEIINTDAEGRLILADSIAYGVQKYKPTAIIDLATLTGACVVALGSYHAGLFSNNDKLKDRVLSAAKLTGDQVWPLPCDDSYQAEIKSDYADIKNVGSRWAGASTAAKFLEHFVDDVPWVHLDIAGTAFNVKGVDFYPPKGATGFGVRLLFNLLTNWKPFLK